MITHTSGADSKHPGTGYEPFAESFPDEDPAEEAPAVTVAPAESEAPETEAPAAAETPAETEAPAAETAAPSPTPYAINTHPVEIVGLPPLEP